MRSKFFKHAGLHSSFLALLMSLFVPVLQAQPSVIHQELVPVGQCRSLESFDPGAFEPMRDFWQQAWGKDLEVGLEGMALQETDVAGIWDLVVSNKGKGRWVDRGTFVEEARHAIDLRIGSIDQVYMNGMEMTSLNRFVVAGTVTGSTGVSMSVAALVSELGDDSGNSVRSFAVIQSGVDPATALEFADATARRLNGRGSTGLETASLEKSGSNPGGNQACVNACISTRNGALQLCQSARDSCLAIAAGVFAACLIACSATTIAFPICAGACDLVLAGSLGLCATNQASCNNDAWNNYYTCAAGCDCSGATTGSASEKFIC